MSTRHVATCDECGWTSKGTSRALAEHGYRLHSCDRYRARRAALAASIAREAAMDRTPKPCLHKIAEHQHGTRQAYVLDRCRCLPCAAANSRAESQRNRDRAYGRNHWADAGPVRVHVRALMAQGMGIKRIAERADVSTGVLTRVLYGINGHSPSKRITPATAQRILALTFDPSPGAIVDSTGTKRRLQALAVVGYSTTRLARETGIEASTIWVLMNRDRHVLAATERAVRNAYDRLWNVDPARDTTKAQGAALARVRREAGVKGWVGPLCWDDDTIADPQTPPVGISRGAGEECRDLDVTAVERASAGDRKVFLTRSERIAVVGLLSDDGMSARQIAERTGLHQRQVDRDRATLNYPKTVPQAKAG